jgi:hypothetical protein
MIQAKEAVLTWDWGNFVADYGREMARVFAVSQELKSIRIVSAKGDQMRSWLYLALLLPICVSAADADAAKDTVTGIYSDLYYNQEGGDLLGMELLIVPGPSGYSAFVQIAEGGAPYTAIVPIHIAGDKVSFALPPGDEYGGIKFEGTWNKTALTIKWPAGTQEVLKRGRSYWQ